jgi:hypothetical protein
VIVPTTTQTPKAIIPAETTISMIGRALFMHQREIVPRSPLRRRATNQAKRKPDKHVVSLHEPVGTPGKPQGVRLVLLSFIAAHVSEIALLALAACRLALARG